MGELAAEHGVVLHELAAQRGSLEAAFMQLTGEDVEFHAQHGPGAAPTVPAAQPQPQPLAPAPAGFESGR